MMAHAAAGRYFAPDVIFIAPRLNESHLHWSADNVAELRRLFPDYTFAAESRGNAWLQTASQQASTTVIYTDPAYFQIHFMAFTQGTRWEENARAIVLNQALAWRLFGSEDVAGLSVTINEMPYVVAGVVRQDPRGQGEFLAWMPHGASPIPLPVTALYLRAHQYNMVDVIVNTTGHDGMLRTQRRNPDDYAIVDINRYIEAMGLRTRIFMYILWLYLLVLLLPVCFRRHGRFRWRKVLGLVLPVCGVIIAAYALFTGVNNVLYWLPNIGDPNVSVIGSITNIGALPPDGYLSFGLLRLSQLNRAALWAWAVGAAALVNVMVSVSILQSQRSVD